MSLRDQFRQLSLLLWKNFTLKSRKKLRIVIEILWPLFLFLILMWVRTRELIFNKPQCHFAERPLPSSGILPFLRGYVCELNNSCSQVPRETYTSDSFIRLSNLGSDTINTLSDPQVITAATTLYKFARFVLAKRQEATVITSNTLLSEVLTSNAASFEQRLFDKSLTPSPINATVLAMILNSNPNFNNLYSNYSNPYSEPLAQYSTEFARAPKEVVNFFYGPNLGRLETNRLTNRVDNSTWIANQMCNNKTNYLLKGADAMALANELCAGLTESQLEQLFTLISTDLDITKAKQKVVDGLRDDLLVYFLDNIVPLSSAVRVLRQKLTEADLLQANGYGSLAELYNETMDLDLQSSICKGSQLSVFTILSSIRFSVGSTELKRAIDNLEGIKDMDNIVNKLVRVSTDGIDLNVKIPGYYKTPKSAYKRYKQSNADKTPRSAILNIIPEAMSFTREEQPSLSENLVQITRLLRSLNKLNGYTGRQCPIGGSDENLDEDTQFIANSTTRSCFCKQMYSFVSGLGGSAANSLFSIIKPLFLGKILYSPNTPAYEHLIKQMNATFEAAEALAQSLKQISVLVERARLELRKPENQNLAEELLYNVRLIADQLAADISLPVLTTDTLDTQLAFASEALLFSHNSLYCVEWNKFKGYPSEKRAIEIGSKLIEKEAFWAAVIFQNDALDAQTLPKIVSYKIRMNSSFTHNTIYTQDRFYRYGPSNCLGCNTYFTYGFIYLQDLLETAIIGMKTNRTQRFGKSAQMTPYPCYIEDRFVIAISRTLPLFLVISWIYTVSMTVKDIVYEKEKRLKEFMRVMGLSNGTHWLAWFLTAFASMFLICIFLSLILKFGRITQHSDFFVLLAFLTCFTIATICQCFLISVFFNRANLAAVVAGIIYFLLYLPYTILINYADAIQPYQKFIASLSSTVAFSYGCEIIGIYELQAEGVQWSNFYNSPYVKYDFFSMNVVCLVLLLDSAVYLVLVWYVETVWPGEFGVSKPWYFPFSPAYWCGNSSKRSLEDKDERRSEQTSTNVISRLYNKIFYDRKQKIILEEEARNKGIAQDTQHIEDTAETDKLEPGIEIKRLHKVYSRGNNHALKGLQVNFYKGEITALLGHNGAGKSTTMHLLTGLYKPTAGTAIIDGHNIKDSMAHVRKSLGFVPQHNVLFPGLTVAEHLWFYARLKGQDRHSTQIELNKMLDDTGLAPKKNEASKNLSGGMKRKLSVAIAFSGGSKTVILDEPSAGVDPNGRRSIWDLLFKFRAGRTIVVSTHHMDEADVLGDRIAIMSNGKLIVHGTSFFLKNQFGQGYYLTIAKKQVDGSDTESGQFDVNKSTSSDNLVSTDMVNVDDKLNNGFGVNGQVAQKEERLVSELASKQDKAIYEFIKERISSALLVENIGQEMTFSISNHPDSTKGYEGFFKEIEANAVQLGIDSIGISETTLEEIFIKLAKEPKSNFFQEKPFMLCGLNLTSMWHRISICCCGDDPIRKLTAEEMARYSTLTDKRVTNKLTIVAKQFVALLVKRFHRVKRNIKGFFAEIVLPVIFVCLALLVATLVPKVADRPALQLHPWYYQSPNNIFVSKSSSIKYDTPNYQTLTSSINPAEQANINEIDKIVSTFYQASSIGTRCLKDYRIKIPVQAEDYRRALLGSELKCEDYNFRWVQSSNLSRPSDTVIGELMRANYSHTKTSLDCDCSQGFPECPQSAGGDINQRQVVQLRTQDMMFDLTSRNVTDWLIKTEFSDQFFRKRYGGFEFLQQEKVDETTVANANNLLRTLFQVFNVTANVTLDPQVLRKEANVKVWYNVKGYDSSVAYLNVLNNALLRSQLPINESGEHGIVAFNHPMNFTKEQLFDVLETRVVIDLFVSIFIIFALSFIPASFLVFLLEERENSFKQLQFVSGVRPYIYWVSNYFWDMFNYIIPCILCILLFLAFNVQAYVSPQNFPCLVLLLLLYGWACIPLMYPLNYLFTIPSTAFVVSSSLNVFIGIVSVMATAILDQLGNDDKDLAQVNSIIKPIFVILFPHYCLGRGLLDMSILYNTYQAKKVFNIIDDYDPFLFDNVGKNLLAMALQGVFYFTLNLFIEYDFFIRVRPTKRIEKLDLPKCEEEDDDVVMERERILSNELMHKTRKKAAEVKYRQAAESGNEDYIKLINLTKVYKKFKGLKLRKHVAVNALSLGINRGECFGLIGINGAGKTTTFKMITGDIPASGGDVKINGYSVSKEIEKIHRSIGYCPQFDALLPLLTSRELLIFFARLRAIPEAHVSRVAEWAMNKVGLHIFANRISGDLSGGNKRKLSTAIALVGNPSVICLDEPTSGMDATARRLLWNDILNLRKENRIVIFTSHSMEECEALCTRLVIMVNGQFKCLGTPHHLKTKFGNGYKLAVRLNDETESRRLFEFMAERFPSSEIQETHRNLFEFLLPYKDTKLSEIFGSIEESRGVLNIKDYSVSQSTLDQVFVNFAKKQHEDDKMNGKLKSGEAMFIDAFKAPVAPVRRMEDVKVEGFDDIRDAVVVKALPDKPLDDSILAVTKF